MRTIYIDSEYKCHVANDGTMKPIETDFFDGKCDFFVEGYRFIPSGEHWRHPNGTLFHGQMIAPFVDYKELNFVQKEYERQFPDLWMTETEQKALAYDIVMGVAE